MKERKPAGPKTKLKNARAINVMLTDEIIEKARAIGSGNISAGVRLAVSEFKEVGK